MISINDQSTRAEVETAFEGYEKALLTNDVPALQNYFWKSEEATRYGVTEQLYSHREISGFRESRVPNFDRRDCIKKVITTFGDSFASVMYEYITHFDSGPRHGRQSQTWVKIEGSWKIVSAHVSLASDPTEYTKQKLSELGLESPANDLATIASHLATTSSLAERLMRYPIPDHIEPAPIFEA